MFYEFFPFFHIEITSTVLSITAGHATQKAQTRIMKRANAYWCEAVVEAGKVPAISQKAFLQPFLSCRS